MKALAIVLLLTACGGSITANEPPDETVPLSIEVTVCMDYNFQLVWTAVANDPTRLVNYKMGVGDHSHLFWRNTGVFFGAISHTVNSTAVAPNTVIWEFTAEGYDKGLGVQNVRQSCA